MEEKILKNNIYIKIAKILSITLFIFVSIFALDVFSEYKFPEIILALFMHLIPSFVLLVILWISWKKNQLIGGILYLLLAIVYMIIFWKNLDFVIILLIPSPLALTGILFILSSMYNKSNKK